MVNEEDIFVRVAAGQRNQREEIIQNLVGVTPHDQIKLHLRNNTKQVVSIVWEDPCIKPSLPAIQVRTLHFRNNITAKFQILMPVQVQGKARNRSCSEKTR